MTEQNFVFLVTAAFSLFSIHALLGQMRPTWFDDQGHRYASWVYRQVVKLLLIAGALTGFLSWISLIGVMHDYAWPWYLKYPGMGGFLGGVLLAQWQSMRIASPVAG